MAFEKKFNLFDDTKRTILYATAALFVLALGVFTYLTLTIGRTAHLSGAIR